MLEHPSSDNTTIPPLLLENIDNMSSEGPFAVPLPAYQLGIHTARKRKRAATSASADAASAAPAAGTSSSRNQSRASSPTGSQYSSHRAGSSRSLPADSINPLSHSPDTLHQFVAAGLSPEDENPGTLYPEFPHRPLPKNAHYFVEAAHVPDNRSFYDGSDADELDDDYDDGDGAGTVSGATDSKSGNLGRTFVQKQTARLKHIAVMTALVHRCIAKGDIPRAKRAFGLLAQTKGVDIKLNNFWLIGSEILMRQGEVPPADNGNSLVAPLGLNIKRRRSSNSSALSEAENDTRTSHDNNAAVEDDVLSSIPQDQQLSSSGLSRWGRPENADTVRNYFEHLIAHYPYDKHRPHLVSAADFYPALYNFEIYHVSAEFAAAIERLEEEYSAGRDDDDEQDSNNSYVSDDGDPDNDGVGHRRALGQDSDEEHSDAESFQHKNHDAMRSSSSAHRRTYRQEATDEIRRQTQLLAQQIASNMDRTMENPPFSSHFELLRLRANLAIFIADLYLPIRILEKVLRALDIPRPGTKSDAGGSTKRRSGAAIIGKTQRRKRAAAIMDNLAKYVYEPEEQAAVLDMRPREQRRARDLFRKVMAQGVVVETWVEKFVEMVDRWDETENEAANYY